MQLKIATVTTEGITILECSGRIVFGDEAAALREQVKDLVAAGKKQIVLNLGGVTYIDSGGLGTLVSLYTTAHNAGGALKLQSTLDGKRESRSLAAKPGARVTLDGTDGTTMELTLVKLRPAA